MSIIKKILIPFNFSETSKNALNYAVNFANDKKEIELHLLHVIKESSNKEKIREELADIASEFQKLTDSKITFSVNVGELVSIIIAYQNESESDIILIGTSGSDDGENTNTAELIRRADCSVIVVPKSNKKFRLKRIAVSLDKEKIDDAQVLNFLLDTTRKFASKVYAVTVLDEETNYSDVDESNEKLLQYYLEKFYSHHSFLKSSDIEKGIFKYTKDNKIDLLTILPRHHSRKHTPSEGKLVNALVKHAQVPLLILD